MLRFQGRKAEGHVTAPMCTGQQAGAFSPEAVAQRGQVSPPGHTAKPATEPDLPTPKLVSLLWGQRENGRPEAFDEQPSPFTSLWASVSTSMKWGERDEGLESAAWAPSPRGRHLLSCWVGKPIRKVGQRPEGTLPPPWASVSPARGSKLAK